MTHGISHDCWWPAAAVDTVGHAYTVRFVYMHTTVRVNSVLTVTKEATGAKDRSNELI